MMRSRRVCEVVGCTYRQLDYLTRAGTVQGMNTGSGTKRLWPASVVVRLALANHLLGAVPISNDYTTPFPVIAAAALAAPDPLPRAGYAVLTPDPLACAWAGNWADLRRAID